VLSNNWTKVFIFLQLHFDVFFAFQRKNNGLLKSGKYICDRQQNNRFVQKLLMRENITGTIVDVACVRIFRIFHIVCVPSLNAYNYTINSLTVFLDLLILITKADCVVIDFFK